MIRNGASESQWIESLKGHRLGPYLGFNPVNATQIWQWCSAMGDNNPCYLPGEGQIAPPAMMQMWTMRDINDNYAPGSTAAPPYQVFTDMSAMGYSSNVAVSYDISIHRDLRPGEYVKHFTTFVNVSDKKSTGLGAGYFVTERVEYLTADDALFADALITYFQYEPVESRVFGEPGEMIVETDVDAQGETVLSNSKVWQPDFKNLDVSTLSTGAQLPPLEIPITRKLIVGGAIATQDYIPVHHDVPAALAAGMPDIFMNILTTSGLSARYLSDWAGSGSRLRHITLTLMSPNLPGDTMTMEGELSNVSILDSGVEVDVVFGGKNGLGYHTKGTATLALP